MVRSVARWQARLVDSVINDFVSCLFALRLLSPPWRQRCVSVFSQGSPDHSVFLPWPNWGVSLSPTGASQLVVSCP